MSTIHKLKTDSSFLIVAATFIAYMIDVYHLDIETKLPFVVGDLPMFVFCVAVGAVVIWNVDSVGNNTNTAWAWGRAAIAIATYCVAIEIARATVSIWNLVPNVKSLVFYVYPVLMLFDFATGVWLHFKSGK